MGQISELRVHMACCRVYLIVVDDALSTFPSYILGCILRDCNSANKIKNLVRYAPRCNSERSMPSSFPPS